MRPASTHRLIDLVEHATISEMNFLRLPPVADDLRQGEERKLWELAGVLRGHRLQSWPIVVLGDDLLTLRRVQIFQIRLRHRPSAMLACYLIHHADRRLSQDADGRNHDLELVLP